MGIETRLLCPSCSKSDGVIKNGFFVRDTGHYGKIQKYYCKECKHHYSEQTGTLTYRERKGHMTQPVMRVAMEAVSQRGISRLLGIDPKTVARKIVRLGTVAKELLQVREPSDLVNEKGEKKGTGIVDVAIFDEMETFEHTKMKPLSIMVGVTHPQRQILAVDVCLMPAKGPQAEKSREIYGSRPDGRRDMLEKGLKDIKRLCPGLKTIISDKCPRYPGLVKEIFTDKVQHLTFKGRRGAVVGQGELKVGGFDPLFSLNHTCAMFRDRIKRLTRRTWCTTKQVEMLEHLLNLYAWWHNQLIRGVKRCFQLPERAT